MAIEDDVARAFFWRSRASSGSPEIPSEGATGLKVTSEGVTGLKVTSEGA
jgi:hypothetical protein